MHLILFEQYRSNTVELDKSIFGDYCILTTVHFRFQCESLNFDSVHIAGSRLSSRNVGTTLV